MADIEIDESGSAEIGPDNPLHGQTGADDGRFDNLTDEDIESTLEKARPKPEPPKMPDDLPDDVREMVEAREGSTKQAESTAPVESGDASPPAPTSEAPEPTTEDLERESLRAELERRDAALKLQQAHGSRLASQIGDLRQEIEKMKTAPTPSDMSDLDGEQIDLVQKLQRDVTSLREAKIGEEVDRAIAEATSALTANPVLAGFEKAEYETLLAPYATYWQDALASKDPATARLLASAVAANLVADAKALKIKKQVDAIQAKKAAQTTETRQRKLASGIVQSSTPGPSKRPAKSFEELSEADQDRILDGLLRASM